MRLHASSGILYSCMHHAPCTICIIIECVNPTIIFHIDPSISYIIYHLYTIII